MLWTYPKAIKSYGHCSCDAWLVEHHLSGWDFLNPHSTSKVHIAPECWMPQTLLKYESLCAYKYSLFARFFTRTELAAHLVAPSYSAGFQCFSLKTEIYPWLFPTREAEYLAARQACASPWLRWAASFLFGKLHCCEFCWRHSQQKWFWHQCFIAHQHIVCTYIMGFVNLLR